MAIWSKMREEIQIKRHTLATELKNNEYLNLDKLTLLDPTIQSQNTQVLQPIPAQQTNKISSYDNMLTKNINISDFESDTSSPFDNMELKTINDLEELASVLKPTSVLNDTNCQVSDFNATQYSSTIYNNFPENDKSNKFLCGANIQTNQPISSIPMVNSDNLENKNVTTLPPVTMPNILLQLKADLNTLKYSDESPVSIISAIKCEKKIDNYSLIFQNDPQKSLPLNIATNGSKSPTCSFPNPYRSLSPTSQCFVDKMHQMGFPISRAARACKLFGKDEFKVCDKFC